MPKLSDEEISDFLKEKNMICRIGTVDESGSPLVTPIWFVFEDEKIYNNNVEIGKVLIDKNYPFALIKYLDKNFNKDQIIKSKTCSFKILIPDWLKI